jgi:hypothetical protein
MRYTVNRRWRRHRLDSAIRGAELAVSGLAGDLGHHGASEESVPAVPAGEQPGHSSVAQEIRR